MSNTLIPSGSIASEEILEIDGNDQLLETALTYGWLGNGSISNPVIVTINTSGLLLENLNLHVSIKNNNIHYSSVTIRSSENIDIFNNTLIGSNLNIINSQEITVNYNNFTVFPKIKIDSSLFIKISNNFILTGKSGVVESTQTRIIDIEHSKYVYINENEINIWTPNNSEYHPVYAYFSDAISLYENNFSNTFVSHGIGFIAKNKFVEVYNLFVANNHITNMYFSIETIYEFEFKNNFLDNNNSDREKGVEVYFCYTSTIYNNTFIKAPIVVFSAHVILENNRFYDIIGTAISLNYYSSGYTLSDNSFENVGIKSNVEKPQDIIPLLFGIGIIGSIIGFMIWRKRSY